MKLAMLIELGTVVKSASPGENACDRVSEDLFTFFPLAVVACNGTMGGLGLNCAGGAHQDTGHKG